MVGGEDRADGERDHGPSTRNPFRGIYLIIGVAVAIAATVALISTDDPRILRLVVVVAVWAFIFAAMAARWRSDRRPKLSTAREIRLRHSYERKLEQEIAARSEQQRGLELYLRRELEAGLAEGVKELRGEVEELHGALIQRWSHEVPVEEEETSPSPETSPESDQHRDEHDLSSRPTDRGM
jgi:hypothetical protein